MYNRNADWGHNEVWEHKVAWPHRSAVLHAVANQTITPPAPPAPPPQRERHLFLLLPEQQYHSRTQTRGVKVPHHFVPEEKSHVQREKRGSEALSSEPESVIHYSNEQSHPEQHKVGWKEIKCNVLQMAVCPWKQKDSRLHSMADNTGSLRRRHDVATFVCHSSRKGQQF